MYNYVNRIFIISYIFDTDGNITKKQIVSSDGIEQVISYEYPENSDTMVKFSVSNTKDEQTDYLTIASHSKTDSFGRRIFDELLFNDGLVSRQFSYYNGDVTNTHKNNSLVKSTPTTKLISQIVLSDGRTLSYEYDANEHITKIIDSVDGTTEHTYDSLGQLLTETVNGKVINTMTYDK